MDDDEFGGFEAAENFEDGETGTQSVSPAIPWAAFSAGPGVELGQRNPPDILINQTTQSFGKNISKSALFPDIEPDSDLRVESMESAIAEQIPSSEKVQQTSQLLFDNVVASATLQEKDPRQSTDLAECPMPIETHKLEVKSKETLENVEEKLSAAEKEKLEMKKALAEMFEKYSTLEEEYLQEKKAEEAAHQDHYNQLQEKHKQQLEDLRKAGHGALSIIIDEFKALTKSAVLQQQETSRTCLQSAIEKQMQKCEELLTAQHEQFVELLEKEKCALQDKIKEALEEQTKQHKDVLEKCVVEERLRSTEAMEKVVQAEKEIITEAVLKAVQVERERMEKIQMEKRELWEIERGKDQEKFEQAIQEALQEERNKSQEAIREAVNQERKKSKKAVEETIQKAREDMVKYIKEQKRLDQMAQQRNLTSLGLFLSCAQKQLSALLEDMPLAVEQDIE
ncbi:coiled-coil domain-containing protein 91-like [Pristis pectinata]|uniref:coiled-coil domain-containing protein 91-like n=1 Tax=Pristis pectinata TaxID=685728 RepID=UPI00223E40DF|nr:coiled-coil domain-containing protein 91-like [Pristis pectinata]XP_051886511.1 coiled-coil domain-containing protein 91-like [Pristis pectinata]XP_051886512.1 coiled-coil domain-containing protein 91-like [Pristis pectinata]